jgi:hypothetical protein
MVRVPVDHGLPVETRFHAMLPSLVVRKPVVWIVGKIGN